VLPPARQLLWGAFAIGLAALVVFAGLGLSGVLGKARDTSSRAGHAAAHTTSTAGATATPRALPLSGATLGGNPHQFDHIYDIPISSGIDTAVYQYTTTDGLDVRLVVTSVRGSDGQLHVVLVTFGPPQGSAGWTQATADTIAPSFLPPDAVPRGIAQTPDGPDYLYSSRRLAATFPPGVFTTDTRHKPVAPGMFDYICGTSTDLGGAIAVCVMQPGAHQ
jgi:hypothetical protein